MESNFTFEQYILRMTIYGAFMLIFGFVASVTLLTGGNIFQAILLQLWFAIPLFIIGGSIGLIASIVVSLATRIFFNADSFNNRLFKIITGVGIAIVSMGLGYFCWYIWLSRIVIWSSPMRINGFYWFALPTTLVMMTLHYRMSHHMVNTSHKR